MTHFLHGASTTYCGGPNASFNLWWQKRVLTRTLQSGSSFSLATASRFRAARHFPIAAHPHPSFRTERADFSSAFAPANASAHGERNLSSSFPAPAPSAEIALMLWLVIKSANAYLF